MFLRTVFPSLIEHDYNPLDFCPLHFSPSFSCLPGGLAYRNHIKPFDSNSFLNEFTRLEQYFFLFRTIDDIQVLEQCEIHPIRTEFAEELGEGAFGKVHKATLKNGFEFFESKIHFSGRTKDQKTVAVKELHGKYDRKYIWVIDQA